MMKYLDIFIFKVFDKEFLKLRPVFNQIEPFVLLGVDGMRLYFVISHFPWKFNALEFAIKCAAQGGYIYTTPLNKVKRINMAIIRVSEPTAPGSAAPKAQIYSRFVNKLFSNVPRVIKKYMLSLTRAIIYLQGV